MNHTPIMKAASFGNFEVMEFLVNHGANVNDNFEMFNVIMCVCNSSCLDETVLLKCLNFLLDKGADPLATDWVGATSLMNAVRRNRLLLAARLIESGCSVNAVDGEGWTPLFYSVQTGSIPMTKFLIESGGDINKLNRYGITLWEHAAPKNDKELSALVMPEDMQEPEDPPGRVVRPCLSQFKLMMSAIPKLNDRMYGYHEDAINFLRGIGLDTVASEMEKRPIQFAELMTWSEQEWIEAGIQLSYQLKKIKLCVTKYHEREWGKGSIPNIANVTSKEDGAVDLFSVVQVLLNCLRNTHISSSTSLYMLTNCHEPLTDEMRGELDKLLKTLMLIKKQIRILKRTLREFNHPNLYPPDLIAPRRKPIPVKGSKPLLVQYTCNFLFQFVVQIVVRELIFSL
uniref:Ankyrin repeat, SAM and basic leucine zipper domain-containing protein 1 n=1 Tax=Lygus hesperus TaxID=30085 RepID=A0A0A9WJZ5_LYGHE